MKSMRLACFTTLLPDLRTATVTDLARRLVSATANYTPAGLWEWKGSRLISTNCAAMGRRRGSTKTGSGSRTEGCEVIFYIGRPKNAGFRGGHSGYGWNQIRIRGR